MKLYRSNVQCEGRICSSCKRDLSHGYALVESKRNARLVRNGSGELKCADCICFDIAAEGMVMFPRTDERASGEVGNRSRAEFLKADGKHSDIRIFEVDDDIYHRPYFEFMELDKRSRSILRTRLFFNNTRLMDEVRAWRKVDGNGGHQEKRG